ncbi:periplasmic heavy metal sensor [candidate division WOR-3 bacterium]|nr:periplasmic heavy metal sensor [candidate division WOR-3 bacterium]
MKQKTVVIVLSILLAASVGLNLGGIGMFALMRLRARSHIVETGPPFMGQLNLSEDQRESLKKARDELREAAVPLRDQMVNKRRAVIELLMDEELDSVKRDSLFADIARLQTKMELIVFDKLFETKAVLNPEQQELLLRMITEEFHHKPGPGMPGPLDGHPGPARGIIKKRIQERREK